jgi:hypothetical protein
MEQFATTLFKLVWSVGACAAMSVGAAGTLYLIYSMGKIFAPGAKKIYTFLTHYTSRWTGKAYEDGEEWAGLLEWLHNHLPSSTLLDNSHPQLKMAGTLGELLHQLSQARY